MLTLSPILHRLASQESPRLLLSLRPQDPIPDWITHLLYLGEDMKITLQGLKEDVGIALMAAAVVTENSNEKIDKLPRFNAEFGRTITEGGVVQVAHDRTTKDISWESAQIIRWNSEAIPPGEAVIEMEGVSVKYGDKPVLGNWKQEVGDPKRLEDGLWWKVRQGQRWGVFGPNGRTISNPIDYADGSRLRKDYSTLSNSLGSSTVVLSTHETVRSFSTPFAWSSGNLNLRAATPHWPLVTRGTRVLSSTTICPENIRIGLCRGSSG